MSSARDPASAGSLRACQRAVALSLALVTAACSNPFVSEVPEVSQEPLPGLSERPSGAATPVPEPPKSQAVGEPPAASTTGNDSSPATSNPEPMATSGASTPSVAPTVNEEGPSAPGRTPAPRSATGDPQGDAGLGAPAYADGRVLVVEDLGTRARVTVKVTSALPATLADQEVMGVGVDFFRSGSTESDYQLFADGGSDGWRAFLQTPDGFVAFPGDFRLSADTIQFEVPWSSLGGPPTGSVRAFVDWGKPTVGGLITRTHDLVPDSGEVRIGSPR